MSAQRVPRLGDTAARVQGQRKPGIGARAARFRQLVGIARRNGLLPLRKLDFTRDAATAALRTRQAEGLRRGLEEAGGAFVKMGQILSTRNDVLPPEWARELAKLQRDVPPAPWDEVEALIVGELGGPIATTFAAFDHEPVAAASIAQVHRARLITGEAVAVKVQRPGIVPLLRRDVDIALRLTRFLSRNSAQARRLGVVDVAQQYANDLLRQADFARELRNLHALRDAQRRSARKDDIRIPAPFDTLCTPRLLTMEFVEGQTLSAIHAGGRTGADLDVVVRTVLRSFLRQIVLDGAYHGDMHPGNIVVTPDGTPALVDFGSVGRFSRELRESVQEILIAYLRADTRGVADAMLELIPLAPGMDERRFRRELSAFVLYEVTAGADFGVDTIDEAIDLFAGFGSAPPPELVAAARAFAIFQGTVRTLTPEFDLVSESRATAVQLIGEQVRPRALRDLVIAEAAPLLPIVRRLPRRIDRIGSALEDGSLNINIRLLADVRDRRMLAGLVRRAVLAIAGGALAVVSLFVFATPPQPESGLLSTPALALILAVSAAVTLGVLVIDAWRARRGG